ncbi:acyltransferase [Janthinobacterium sp. OK676]|uniref:acyltransferase family protein n=1 Tax=Janthinobacterium sp. OK676 TaxID=1855295 RepID=UPI000B87D6E7|nr:acyltransferase [Janthinobacterium sp. OK676]
MMDVLSFLPAAASLALALLCCLFIVKRWGAPPLAGRFATIDGLRGYLAFFVFLHHSCIWYFYARYGSWSVPPSNMYTNFGQGSVAMFFMITSFLFFTKLLHSRQHSFDWGKLYTSRIMRLTPLYMFAMLLLFSIVFYISGARLNVDISQLLLQIGQWLMFTPLGAPDLNGVAQTSVIVAGVTWSLPYEWLFYLLLPLLALPLRIMPPWPYLLLSMLVLAVTLVLVWYMQAPVHHFLAFLSGICAALLVQREAFRRFCAGRWASILAVTCLVVACLAFPTAHEGFSLLLLSVGFALIAGGSSLFGVLNLSVSRTLGEFAYSIYLLHGLLLFVTFHFLLGSERARELSPAMHWSVIMLLTPVLVFGCLMTFRCIERPGMHYRGTPIRYLSMFLGSKPSKDVPAP